jgi:hypothetical protein
LNVPPFVRTRCGQHGKTVPPLVDLVEGKKILRNESLDHNRSSLEAFAAWIE